MKDRIRFGFSTFALFVFALSGVALAADSVYLKSSHDVNQIGGFTQQIPIEVPPGTAGLQPSLALVYNSQMTNGLLGKGWSVSGLSIISRCGATVAQDGYSGGVTLASTDRFCLDGVKLIAVSGTYGASGTEYRTETETFSRVFSYGTEGTGPLYFTVKTRSGQTMSYGTTPDSRLAAQGSSNAIIWALSKVQDLQTNYYTVSYTNDSVNGQYYPFEINYTGNVTAGVLPYNSIKFIYENRPDNGAVYRSNVMMKTLVRLTHIQTYANEAAVFDYQLNYQLSGQSGNSLLTGVNVASADGTKSLLPLSFGWNAPNGTYSSSIGVPAQILSNVGNVLVNYVGGAGAGNNGSGLYNLGGAQQWLTGDFSGDGVTDFVQLAPGISSVPVCASSFGGGSFSCTNYTLSSAFSGSSTAAYVIGDFDGDGLSDISQVDRTINSMRVCYSQGDGHFSCEQKNMPGLSGGTFISGDFNGDGRTDILEYGDPGSTVFEICLSHGRGVDNSCSSKSPAGYSNWSSSLFIADFLLGDFDGDGLTDFMETSAGIGSSLVCYANWDETFSCETKSYATLPLASGMQSEWFTGDLNTDGLTDIAIVSAIIENGAGGVYVCSSVGRGQNPSCYSTPAPPPVVNSTVPSYPVAVADFNGDGRTDYIFEDGSNWKLCYAGSNGTFNCTQLTPPSGAVRMAGNFGGDGAASILSVGQTSSSGELMTTPSVYPDLLTTVTNGLGATTSIFYAPLTNDSVYQKGNGAIYPTRDIQNSTYVVSSVQGPDGIGGTRTTSFTYAGGKQDLQGRGFLGFATVSKVNVVIGQKSQTDYNQAYPFIGFPSSSSSWVLENSIWGLATQDTYTYANMNFGGTREFPYLATEVNKKYDFINGTLTSTLTTQNQYDAYGNLSSTTVSTGDGYQKVTTNTFNNIAGGPNDIWYLGQLATAQQQNTNPDGTTVTRNTQFTYSSSLPNQLVAEELQPGEGNYLTKTYGYDAWGNRNSVNVSGSNMATRNTSIIYDSRGQFPITITNAYNQTEHRSYDPRFGILSQLQDINNLTTTWSIDSLGRKTVESRPDGTQTVTTFSICTSNCGAEVYNVQVTNTGAPTVTTFYDFLDREYQQSMGGFNSSTIWRYKTYDVAGRIASVSRKKYNGDASYYTKYYYDNGNRVVLQVDPDGSSKKWSYDGLSTTITNSKKQTRTEIKNSLGQVIQVTDAANKSTQYTFDPFGNLTTTTDPLGHKIVLTYDVMGRKIGMVDPDTGMWSYTYNGAGELLTQTDAKNQTMTMTYDNLGRIVSRQTAEFTATWNYDTASNGIGKVASVSNSSGFSKSFSYDSYGRVASEQTTADTTYTIGTSYDGSGHISQVTYPTGFSVNYVYDANGYLREIDNASTSAMLWQRNSQNADNFSIQDTFGNGVVSTSGYYGPTGRLKSIVAMSGSIALQDLSLGYDYLGNVTKRTDLVNHYTGATLTETYLYDNLNRLTSARNPNGLKNFNYDALGNLISKTDVGNIKYGDGNSGRPLHAVMSTNGPTHFSFSYDANGNMISGEGRTINWTSFNKPANISNSTNSLDIYYDPMFERYKEVETTCSDYLGNTSSNCVKYLINPRQDIGIHFEKEINGSITSYRHFLYAGPGNVIGVYTTRSDSSSSTRYFHKDHLGSIVLSTYENGAISERLSYDAFGKRRNIDGTDDPGSVLRSVVSHQGFTGHEHLDDGGLGLINMNGRIYDPLIGRFLSPDPVVQEPMNLQNLNRYSYVINNPVSLIDPSGYWFMNDVVNWISDNAGTIAKVAVVVAATVVTGGAATALLAPALGGFGASLIAGALAGGVAGGLGSAMLGGGFSWQAVGQGALMGMIMGGVRALPLGSYTSGGVPGFLASQGANVAGAAFGAKVQELLGQGKFSQNFWFNFGLSELFMGTATLVDVIKGSKISFGANNLFSGYVQADKPVFGGGGMTVGTSTAMTGDSILRAGASGAAYSVHEFGHVVQYMALTAGLGTVLGSSIYGGLGIWGAVDPDGSGKWWEDTATYLGSGK